MTAKDENFMMGLDRLNALLAWWGIPNAKAGEQIDAQMKRFQTLIADLQQAQSEAYKSQVETLFTARARVAGSLQQFTHCRQPEQVIAAGSTVLATILESVSLQAQTWAQLTQKVQDCYTEIAREALAETSNPTIEASATKPQAKSSDHSIAPVVTAGDHSARHSTAGSAAAQPAKVA